MSQDPGPFLRAQVADVCGIDPADVTDDAKLLGLGLDSARLLDLVISIEEEYGLELSESDPRLAQVKRFSDLVEYTRQQLDAR